MRLFDNARGILAVEDNKPDCIEILKKLTKEQSVILNDNAHHIVSGHDTVRLNCFYRSGYCRINGCRYKSPRFRDFLPGQYMVAFRHDRLCRCTDMLR